MAGGEKRGVGLHPYLSYLKATYPDYDSWVASQGVPVITGSYVADCRTTELFPWERMGGRGVFINLSDQTFDDAYILEIEPAGSTRPQRHLFEELVYVVAGHGATSVWHRDEADPVQFEWQEGSFFSMPLNARYQHFNGDGAEPVRLLAATTAPLTINLFHSIDFVFDCPYDFNDRFDGRPDFFNGDKEFREEVLSGLWETNFVADIRQVELRENTARGKGQMIFFSLAGSTMKSHVSRFPVGTYKKAHAHGPGAHIYILDGEGYTLMWEDGEEPRRYDWHEGSLISPPNGWFHQHFNLGRQPATYLALQRPQVIYNKGQTRQIEYEDEDPTIRAEYFGQLAERGITPRMDPLRSNHVR